MEPTRPGSGGGYRRPLERPAGGWTHHAVARKATDLLESHHGVQRLLAEHAVDAGDGVPESVQAILEILDRGSDGALTNRWRDGGGLRRLRARWPRPRGARLGEASARIAWHAVVYTGWDRRRRHRRPRTGRSRQVIRVSRSRDGRPAGAERGDGDGKDQRYTEHERPPGTALPALPGWFASHRPLPWVRCLSCLTSLRRQGNPAFATA